MKKKFVIHRLENQKQYAKDLKKMQVVGFVARNPDNLKLAFYQNNLELPPNMKAEWDKEKQELCLRVSLNEGDYLSLGDAEGIADKKRID